MNRDDIIKNSLSTLPIVSIIVPSYNGEKYIENCISSLLNQNYPKEKREIIVVIDPKTEDSTKTIVQKYSVKYLVGSRGGAAACRNEGVNNAKGEIVAFIDDDSIADKNWLRNLVQNLEDEDFAGVGGNPLPPHQNVYSEYLRIFGHWLDYWDLEKGRRIRIISKEKYRTLPTSNIAFRRHIFQELGGFDTSFPSSAAEDRDFLWRLLKKGNKMVFDSSAITYHYGYPSRLLEFARNAYKLGRDRILFYKKHPDFVIDVYGHKSSKWGQFQSLISFFLFSAILVLVLVFLPIYVSLLLIIATYVLLTINYNRLKPRGGFKHAFFFPTIKLVAFISWNLGLLRGLIKYH